MTDGTGSTLRDRLKRNLEAAGIPWEEPDPFGPDAETVKSFADRRRERNISIGTLAQGLRCSDAEASRLDAGEERMTWEQLHRYNDLIAYGEPVFNYSLDEMDAISNIFADGGSDIPRGWLVFRAERIPKYIFHEVSCTSILDDIACEYDTLLKAIDTISEFSYPKIDEVIDLGEGLFEMDRFGVIAKKLRPHLEALRREAMNSLRRCRRDMEDIQRHTPIATKPGPAAKPKEGEFTDRAIDLWRRRRDGEVSSVGLDKAHEAFFTAVVKPVFSFKPYQQKFGLSWTSNKFRTSVARWKKKQPSQ